MIKLSLKQHEEAATSLLFEIVSEVEQEPLAVTMSTECKCIGQEWGHIEAFGRAITLMARQKQGKEC